MSQYNLYSGSGLRATPAVPYESATIRGISGSMQEIPMRSHYAFEPQLSVPRGTHTSYDQDPRAMPFRDLDHGRPGSTTIDDSGSGHIRGLQDSQRGEPLQQARQPRIMPVDASIRYGQPEVIEPTSQTNSWNHLAFADPDLVDLSNGHGNHILSEQPTFAGSPRSNSGRAARPLAPASDDNLSTATTAVDSGRPNDSEMHQEISRLASSVANIEQIMVDIQRNQVITLKMLKEMVKKGETTDTATTTRLSDFRDSMDKRFERQERSTELSFDELWERVSAIHSDTKRVREVMTGHDLRTTPPTDDANHDVGAKRRRFEG